MQRRYVYLTRYGPAPKNSHMHAGASPTFALVRIPRGEPKPSEEIFLQALQEDRKRLCMPASNGTADMEIAGPYAILVDGAELDEYVVWER